MALHWSACWHNGEGDCREGVGPDGEGAVFGGEVSGTAGDVVVVVVVVATCQANIEQIR